jgi:hypothetical protein
MANPDRPRGFRPVKTKSGAPYTGHIRAVYSLAADRSSDSTNNHGDIYIGDPIVVDTSGVVAFADSNVAVTGVAIGFGHASTVNFGADGTIYSPAPPFDPSNLTKRYLAYNEAGWVYYVDVQDVLFEIQSASDLDLEVGSLADTTGAAATAHGSRTTGFSDVELTTASDNDVKVVEIVLAPDNDPTLANTRYLVEFFIQNFEANNAT